MTGLEAHPILKLPTREEALRMGKERFEALRLERARRMTLEKTDRLRFGFEPEIWHVVDDLLVDGNTVVLDLERIAKLMPDGSGPDGRNRLAHLVDVPKEIIGTPEIWIGGSNRSSKSEYGVKKLMKVLTSTDEARTWSFADTGPISVARQQPKFWEYLPAAEKRMAAATGKMRQGPGAKITYSKAGGFAGETFVLLNLAQHWFKNYAQDIENMEGDQLDAVLFDELRNVSLLKTVRGRMGDRSGIIIVSFTAIDENYSQVVDEYEKGSRLVLEVEAELLPIRKPRREIELGKQESRKKSFWRSTSSVSDGSGDTRTMAATVEEGTAPKLGSGKCGGSTSATNSRVRRDVTAGETASPQSPFLLSCVPDSSSSELVTVGYEKVPRVKVAGPGSDGDQRANIVYFHITDNPYYGFSDKPAKAGSAPPLMGKERFYRMYRGAIKSKILARVYGILKSGNRQRFPEFNEAVHVIDPAKIPRRGTNYNIADPCSGRNWFMLWGRLDARDHLYIYREWPSHGHSEKSAYIPGQGDPGPWTLPGRPRGAGAKPPEDGDRGPAQSPFGFSLTRMRLEILRCEGHPDSDGAAVVDEAKDQIPRPSVPNPLTRPRGVAAAPKPKWEEIQDRLMDSRYGASPTQTKEGQTTLIESMNELGMEFLAASGKDIAEGIDLIHERLDYDKDVELGEWSPRLARMNEPTMHVSRNCPNLIYALQNWTGLDGGQGACKDPIDVLRYLLLANPGYVEGGVFAWVGGGSY